MQSKGRVREGFTHNMFKFLGIDSNEKEIKRLEPFVEAVNAIEPEFEKLTADELKAKTAAFKARIAEAIAQIPPQLAEAQKELAEAEACRTTATWDLGKDEAEKQCQQAKDKIKQIEKERLKLEREALDGLLPEAFAAVRE